MSEDRLLLQSILDRLMVLEKKVDRLMSFKAWLLGLGAAAGAIASVVLSWLRGQS